MSDELIVFLRTHRKQAGLTQKELAAACGVSRKTVNTIENGVFVPSTIVSLKLAHVLGVEVAQLFALADPPQTLDLSSD